MSDTEDLEINIKYLARKIQDVPTKPGCWNYTKVGIFEQKLDKDHKNILSENQIGEYIRNYSFNEGTFCPFQKNGKWYALYSKEYMYTRIMSLPDCTDLGGEDEDNTEYKNHFCPMDYYVPLLCVQDFKPGEVDPHPYNPRHDPEKWCKKVPFAGGIRYVYPNDKDSDSSEEQKQAWKEAVEKSDNEHEEYWSRHPFIYKYADFGFVEGCQWGDDTSGKLEVLDLREVEKGILKRTDNFGYLELPRNCNLEQAIDTEFIEGNELSDWSKIPLYIAKPFRVNLDGSYASWWLDEKFKKLINKYQQDLTDGQLNKLKEIFQYFFTRGLNDSSCSDGVFNKIDEIIDLLLYKRVDIRYKEVSFFKSLYKLVRSTFGNYDTNR